MNIAIAAAGRLKGGAAKVSVLSSALFGSISGSASANVASTGMVTLPSMRSLGYPKRIAAAVEAVAPVRYPAVRYPPRAVLKGLQHRIDIPRVQKARLRANRSSDALVDAMRRMNAVDLALWRHVRGHPERC